jgi:hypothetical protein
MTETPQALDPGVDLKFPNDVPDTYDGYEYLIDEHGCTVALVDQSEKEEVSDD